MVNCDKDESAPNVVIPMSLIKSSIDDMEEIDPQLAEYWKKKFGINNEVGK